MKKISSMQQNPAFPNYECEATANVINSSSEIVILFYIVIIMRHSKNFYLQMYKVVMCSNFNSKWTRIHLNNRSQWSFVCETLVHVLNLKPVGQEILSLYSFGMQREVEKVYLVIEVKIKRLD